VARALIVVDFQNDFTPGGALAVSDGDAIAERVNELAASGDFDLVVATRDWHPPDHGSFADQSGPWPVHCVAGTPGAELHPSFDTSAVDEIVDKGQPVDTEGYSGFDGTPLAQLLRKYGIDEVTVVGLATDYCVRHTALDALREGLRVRVDPAAVRGVDVEPGDGERALDELREAGALVG
jgi:nicotinamidase/pyrazinamidase